MFLAHCYLGIGQGTWLIDSLLHVQGDLFMILRARFMSTLLHVHRSETMMQGMLLHGTLLLVHRLLPVAHSAVLHGTLLLAHRAVLYMLNLLVLHAQHTGGEVSPPTLALRCSFPLTLGASP